MSVPTITQEDPRWVRRHIGAYQYAIGPDGRWIKSVSKDGRGLRAGDAGALLCNYKVTEVDTGEVLKSGEDCHLRAKEDDEEVNKLLTAICRFMCVDEICSVEIPGDAQGLSDGAIRVEVTLVSYYRKHVCGVHKSVEVIRADDKRLHFDDEDGEIEKPQRRIIGNPNQIVAYTSAWDTASSWRPEMFSVVTVNYQLILKASGEIIVDTFAEGKPHVFTIGCGDVPAALDLGIRKFCFDQRGYIMAESGGAFGPFNFDQEWTDMCDEQAIGGIPNLPEVRNLFHRERSDRDREGPLIIDKEFEEIDGNELKRLADDALVQTYNFSLVQSSIDYSPFYQSYSGQDVIVAKLHLLNVRSLPAFSAISKECDKMTMIRRLRQIGNDFFGISDWIRASHCYTRALEYLNILPANYDWRTAVKKERTSSATNRGMCLVKMNRFQQAADLLKPVLAKNPDHARATFWAGQAFLGLDQVITAEEYFKRARRMAPKDPKIKEALKRCKTLLKEQRERDLQVAKNLGEFHYEEIPTVAGVSVDVSVEQEDDLEELEFDKNLLSQFGLDLGDGYDCYYDYGGPGSEYEEDNES